MLYGNNKFATSNKQNHRVKMIYVSFVKCVILFHIMHDKWIDDIVCPLITKLHLSLHI